MNNQPRILVAYYGILRSINLTAPSIDNNIILPLSKFADVTSFAHLFRIDKIINPRSSENINVDFNPSLLNVSILEVDAPDCFIDSIDYDFICSYGDTWNDGFKSVKNLLNQLYSLLQVKSAILDLKPDYVFFCRPDLIYHSSITQDFFSIINMPNNSAVIPYWQRFGGLNDRFAICDYTSSITYSSRFNFIYDFLLNIKTPLNGERLLHYVFLKDKVNCKPSKLIASRCRANGIIKDESFVHYKNIGIRPYFRDKIYFYKSKFFSFSGPKQK